MWKIWKNQTFLSLKIQLFHENVKHFQNLVEKMAALIIIVKNDNRC